MLNPSSFWELSTHPTWRLAAFTWCASITKRNVKKQSNETKTFSTTSCMQISPTRKLDDPRPELGGTTTRASPCDLAKKQLSIGFEPKRLGSLASPASAFALEGESGREVLVYRATRNRCANNVSTYESTSKSIGTFFCQVTPSNIFLLCDNGRARAESSVANKRQVLHTTRGGFFMQQKNCRVKKCRDRVVVLGIEVSDGKISFASSSRELLERCDVVG
jgi:hypothetical protein